MDEDEEVEIKAVESDAEALDSWETFHERIDSLIVNEHCDAPIRKLDERRRTILDTVRNQFQTAPKGTAERCATEKPLIDQQLELSSRRLDELVRFGDELVTNVRVANERRELNRRMFEATQQAQTQVMLQRESIESMAKFEDIKARWTELEDINEPMMLWDQIEDQKKRIAEIMQRKDEMIDACQKEVDRINAKYDFDRERQAQDLCCLVERVDHQVEVLKEAYKQHLQMLRHTIEEERQLFAVSAVEKWRTFFDALNKNFDEKANLVRTRQQFYANQTQHINASQEELTKSTRIRLDKECERLELELRRTRDNVLMNSEKLDYNYQVLQKRNEENVIINNQQKRRVARLYESIGRIRRSLKNLYLTGKRNIDRLSQDIYKLHANIHDMELKAHQARLNNKEKFNRIWEINFKELNLLVDRVYHIDRIIHEQQLALPWKRPIAPIENINKTRQKHNNVLERFDLRIGRVPKNRVVNKTGGKFKADIKELPVESLRLMRTLVRKLADRGGFLIEQRLIKILEPYSEEDKCLVRLDNIFAALRIQRLSDVHELTQVFLPYTYCPNCQPGGLSPRKCAEVFMKHQKSSRLDPDVHVQLDDEELHREQEPHMDTLMVKGYEMSKVCKNHYLVMEPALCLHAMNLYTTKMHKQMYHNMPGRQSIAVNLIQFSDDDIRNFWRKFIGCFPPAKCKLWKTLEHGLNHYVEVLKMRVQYDAEVVFLRRQNEELRHLLQKFKMFSPTSLVWCDLFEVYKL
ncbi:dynein regulatory complex protein 1 homolog [Drosophila madeirensis]|uniref:Dynein regulatory complex protein 1 homolog n=1 Tax=Drosophila madeirensis TaxID=30013 RepID=A0AAU9FZ28_DROMD